MKKKFLAQNKFTKTAIIGLASMSLVIGLSPMVAQASTDAQAAVQPDKDYFKALGWDIEANSSPDMACSDVSLKRVMKSGLKLGIYQGIPFFDIQSGKETTGIDWDINIAVAKYLGIKTVKSVILQWPEMVPSLLSRKIDVIGGNIHGNPGRYKNFAFTAPAWWYATVVVAAKGNPKGIKAWADLTKPGIKVGVIAGSQAAAWVKDAKIADVSQFTTSALEFAALAAGRVDALVEDEPSSVVFINENPKANVQIVKGLKDVPPDVWANYARYGTRFQDCTLNMAYSRALGELIMHGVIGRILDKHGFSRTENIFEPEHNPAF
jgi:polar amino acid transport system substrate-binding protein